MEPAIVGLILDSSVIIAAERKHLTVPELFKQIREKAGEVELAICAMTVVELTHGIHRAVTVESCERRRAFVDDVKNSIPVHPITAETGEIAGKIAAEQAAKGIGIPTDDLLIGAAAIEQGYAVATANVRHFRLIPGLVVVPL